MPIYEYKCERCEKVFELRRKFSDEPLTVHDECGGPVHRLISAPAFQFKGSGWYITDYARAGKGGEEFKKESASEAKSESKAESKSESKTDSNGSKAAGSESKSSSSESPSKSESKPEPKSGASTK